MSNPEFDEFGTKMLIVVNDCNLRSIMAMFQVLLSLSILVNCDKASNQNINIFLILKNITYETRADETYTLFVAEFTPTPKGLFPTVTKYKILLVVPG